MRLAVEGEGGEWHTVYAWAFLEDVYRLRTADMSGDNRAWQAARLMGACASSLRNACEVKFEGNFSKATDQDLMWFVTAARHLSAHGKGGGVTINLDHLKIHWDSKTRSGWAEAPASITLNLEHGAAALTTARREMALRYLALHGESLYSALHAATRTVAIWTGARLDDDFEVLAEGDYGAVTIRLPLTTTAQRDKLVRVARGRGNFVLPLSDLERKVWSIHGRWADDHVEEGPHEEGHS